MTAQIAHARLLVDAFAQAGVTDVVLSPGSRSTPLVLALAEHGSLRCIDVLDERSAAFVALGQARVTGRPTLVVCTSGTAPAHWYPAVVESNEARVPIVLLSADRPFELQSCGASQTVDQLKLFGDHVRWFAEVGLPDGTEGMLRAARRIAVQAVARSLGPVPGPVHVNVRARKPLEPRAVPTDEDRATAERAELIAAEPPARVFAAQRGPSLDAVRAIADRCAAVDEGVIVAGPAPLASRSAREAVLELARATGYPLLAEATSQLRFVAPRARHDVVAADAFGHILRSSAARALRPEIAILLGDAPVSSAWNELASTGRTRQIVVSPSGWPDPRSSASMIVESDVGDAARAVVGELRARRGPRRPTDWAGAWARADAAAWRAVATELEQAGDALGEGAAVRALVRSLPPGSLLAVGNSLPVRHLDAYCEGGGADLGVLSQRGAAGIDGLVSGAAGAALASDVPVALLAGDVSFLHDVGGLFAARAVRQPLIVLVLNNGGGRIFEQLPIASSDAGRAAIDRFTTPHALDLSHAAALYGLGFARAATVADLRSAIAAALSRSSCTVIEAIVPPHGARDQAARIRGRVEAAVPEVLR